MASDIDIYRTAALLLKPHGKDAPNAFRLLGEVNGHLWFPHLVASAGGAPGRGQFHEPGHRPVRPWHTVAPR